jgi:hypothetical protein
VPLGPFQIRTYRVPRDPAEAAVEVDLLERPIDESAEDGRGSNGRVAAAGGRRRGEHAGA